VILPLQERIISLIKGIGDLLKGPLQPFYSRN